jgi:hypothetical protein
MTKHKFIKVRSAGADLGLSICISSARVMSFPAYIRYT